MTVQADRDSWKARHDALSSEVKALKKKNAQLQCLAAAHVEVAHEARVEEAAEIFDPDDRRDRVKVAIMKPRPIKGSSTHSS